MAEAVLGEEPDKGLGAEGPVSVTWAFDGSSPRGSSCMGGLAGLLHSWLGTHSCVNAACSRVQQCDWMSM